MIRINFIYLFCFVTFSLILFSYEPYVMRLNMKDDYQSIQFNKLDFGIHPLATTGLDTALGERELPPFIPPDGLHGVFLIDDTLIGNNLWSYINLMPFPKSKKDSVVFRFEVHNIVQALNFSWLPIPNVIDSAYIRDRYTGNLVKISLKDSLSAKITNKSITKFEIVVWFDNISDIDDNECNNHKIILFPNPTSDKLIIQSDYLLIEYQIFNQLGKVLSSGKLDNSNTIIKLDNLASGIYFIKFLTKDGIITTHSFIKF